jgi:superfamily II DNA or RNA helicase
MITLFPTKIVLNNYDAGDSSKLEKSLSVWDRVTFSYDFSAFLHDDEKRELIIPGGYDMGKLKAVFPRDNYIDKRNETNPYNQVSFSLKFPPRDDIQRGAIDFLLKTKSSQKFLCLPTGKGKTYCSIHYVHKSKKLPLVLVDQENLMEQWKKSILHFTSVKEEEIFLISGKSSIEKLNKMKKSELKKYKWFIAIHRTLNNYLEENMGNIEKLFTHLGVGVKLYDEAHVEYKNIFYIDSLSNTESIYITATPLRSNPIENGVYQNIFRDVPMFKVHDDALVNYHNVIIVKYNSKPSIDDQARMKGRHGFDTNAWCKYIIQDGKYEVFFDTVIQVLNKVNSKQSRKAVFLFHTMEGNAILTDDFKAEFPNISVGRYDSSIKDKNKRALELEKDLIITTDKSFGKAIDVKGLEIVFNTVPFGSKAMTEQLLGRLREIPEKEVWYIDFLDVGFESCRNQLKQRRNIYNKKAKNIYEIDLTK